MTEPTQSQKRKGSRSAAAKAATKAGGITLLSAGTISIAKDAHLLDNGKISFDSFFHMQMPATAQGVSISDGGVGLNCDQAWTIDNFATGWSHTLGERPPAKGIGDEPRQLDPKLIKRIDEVAAALITSAPHGDVLVIGSTDPRPVSSAAVQNSGLADRRADVIKGLLQAQFGSARSVISGNQALKYSGAKGAVDNELARLLFGA